MSDASERGPAPPLRILVIDDNCDAADTLSTLLRLWGFEVRAVYTGGEAIATAREFKPDCVLTDIGLPDLDGYRIAELFRQDDALKHVPLIAISAVYDSERTKAAGFDYELTKPASPTLLQTLLKRFLQMDKRLERADEIIQKQGEVVSEAKELIKEVKTDMKEIKEEIKEVKQDVQEIKEKLQDD
jgi:CheY-like chemotaxis protein